MDVWGFGTYDTTRHPRAGIVLDGLRAHGVTVREFVEPLGFSTAERVQMLHRPWLAHRLVGRLARTWWRLARAARRALREQAPDAVVVGYLGHFDVVLARLVFGHRTRIVLDLMIFAADTARDRGTGHPLALRALGALDRLAVRCCDLVMLDTDEHRDLLPAAARDRAVVVAVGAPDEWFAGPRVPAGPDAPLRVVFFGLFTPLQGAVTIGRALARLRDRPDIRVTMVGRGQDLDEARQAAHGADATWVPWVEPARLPALVAGHDVCLGIFGTTPKAARVVPNKVFQGAAAGCAVVTSDTAPQRRALADAAVYVPAGDPDALAAALRTLADDRTALAAARRAAAERAARSFSPAAVIGPLLAALAGPPAG